MGGRIIIVGGGVIGLSIAEHCLRRGLTPVVLDRGAFAREASWAGGGYLDLRSAARVGGAFFSLCKKSYDLFLPNGRRVSSVTAGWTPNSWIRAAWTWLSTTRRKTRSAKWNPTSRHSGFRGNG